MPDLKTELYNQLNQRKALLSDSQLRKWHQHFQTDPDIINLSLGEPAFKVSEIVTESIQKAISERSAQYATTQGYEPLRDEIRTYMKEAFDAPDYTLDEVLITIGATEGIYVAMQAMFEAGDEIIVPVPMYPLYRNIAQLLGLKVIGLDTSDSSFRVTPALLTDCLAQYPQAKGFIFNDPTNPTGVAYTESEICALAHVLAQTNLVVLTDEIYGALTYKDKHVTLAKYLPDQTVIVGGLSKSHAMPGYRLGFVLGPKDVIHILTQVHQLTVGSVPLPLMIGAVSALTNSEFVNAHKVVYQVNRDILVAGLQEAGLHVIEPEGAFYILAKLPISTDIEQFVLELAAKAKVGVLPGNIFDAEGYVRLSFSGATDDIIEAVKRIKKFMA